MDFVCSAVSQGRGSLSYPVSKLQYPHGSRIYLRLLSGVQRIFWGKLNLAGLILRCLRFLSDRGLGKTKRRNHAYHLFFDVDDPTDHVALLAGTAFRLPAFATIYIFRLPGDEIYPEETS